MGRLTDDVRASCAADRRRGALGADRPRPPGRLRRGRRRGGIHDPGLDPVRHYLEGTPADVAMYLLSLDTINFGSGWFPTLRKRVDSTTGRRVGLLHRRLGPRRPLPRARRLGHEQLRAMRTEELATILGQPADHELMASTPGAARARALPRHAHRPGRRRRGQGLGRAAGRDARRRLAFYDDRGFYKRAQIVPNDLARPASRPSPTSTR